MIQIYEPSVGKKELQAGEKVFKSKWIGKGKVVDTFIDNISKKIIIDSDNLITINSCTEGLFQSLDLFDISEGDEVILPSVSWVGAGNAIVSTSDCRAKCNIAPTDLGLDFIKALKPVKFKMRTQRDILDEDGNLVYGPERGRGTKQVQYGLLSQDVMSTITDMGKTYEDFGGLLDDLQEPYTQNSDGERLTIASHEKASEDREKYWGQGLNDYDPDNPDGLFQKTQGLNYEQFIAPLIKAVQELDAENTALKSRVTVLEG